MSGAKHTPGPWLADGGQVYSEQDDFSVICTFWSSTLPEWEANARLIAAAPDLLEALEEIRDMLWSRPDISNRLRPLMGFAEEATSQKARAAVARAKGE